VPRDVDPRASRLKNLHLYDIDDLQGIAESHAESRRAEVAKVEAIVGDHVGEFMLWLRSLSAAPLITALTDKFDAIRRQELDRHKKSLGRLSEHDRAVVERVTASLVKKLLHAPIVRIKHDLPGAEPVVRRLFELDEGPDEE
jgi:glutamyl-tRNA reductase